MKVYNSMVSLIGNTPILNLMNFERKEKLVAHLYAKLESFNPAGSIKDRIAKSMIEDAEKKGIIQKNTIIIEPTSGNTGIALAAICASKGYSLIITMPETMSIERRKLMQMYGAKIILTEGSKGMKGAIEKANKIHLEHQNSILLGQFSHPSNPQAHYQFTAKEIDEAMEGKIDYFLAGVGTGGTISGVGKYFKEKNTNIKIIAIEPKSSPFLSKGIANVHEIQGIGAGFIPDVLDTSIYDDIILAPNEKAFEYIEKLAKTEGILAGISSGAVLYAASIIAKRKENKDKNIVFVLPDSGERYLSTFF